MFKSQQIQQISLESYRARVPVQLDPIVISIAQVCEDAQVVEYNGQKLAIFSVGEHQYHCAFDHTILEHLHKYNIVVWGAAAEQVAKMARTGTVVRIVGQYAVDYCDKDDDFYMADYVLLEKIEYVYPKQPEENPKDVIRQITDQIIQNDSFHGLDELIPLMPYVDITSKSEV
ncbi:MAG: single-stranded DNA-binding protein [Bacteroidales bacterium]|nr:single-stranded DNA-binding protein [Bacteroidales bacterium]